MPSMRRRFLAAATAALLAIAAPARGQALAAHPPPHVRPEKELRTLFDEALRRSPTLRDVVERLEEMDVTVYIRHHDLGMSGLDGRVALLSMHGTHRYLVIELACGRADLQAMATLGHELFHAGEIASEPSVVDAETMATYYARIGKLTGSTDDGNRTYETRAAAAIGTRVRQELLTSSTRNSNGT
jgi:hypothetical protein